LFIGVFVVMVIFPANFKITAIYDSAVALPGLEFTQEIILGYLFPSDPAEVHNYDFVCGNVIFFLMLPIIEFWPKEKIC